MLMKYRFVRYNFFYSARILPSGVLSTGRRMHSKKHVFRVEIYLGAKIQVDLCLSRNLKEAFRLPIFNSLPSLSVHGLDDVFSAEASSD